MKRKKVNYDDIINKLDDYLKKSDEKYMIIFTALQDDGRHKVTESDGITPKEFFIDTDEELDEYLREKGKNPNCQIIKCVII